MIAAAVSINNRRTHYVFVQLLDSFLIASDFQNYVWFTATDEEKALKKNLYFTVIPTLTLIRSYTRNEL